MLHKKVKLRSPAGTLSSLKEAIASGADGVYVGFRSLSSARYYPGLNFTMRELEEGIKYAHKREKGVYVAANLYPQVEELEPAYQAVKDAYELGADAVIVTDIAVLDFVKSNFPDLPIHLSVQAGACNIEAIRFFEERYGIKCVVLPRVLTLQEIKEISSNTNVELEAFVFGILCIDFEGRCYLCSYLIGETNNSRGACAPPQHVSFETKDDSLSVKLRGHLLDSFAPDEFCAYPTPCKGRFKNLVLNKTYYPIQDPYSFNLLAYVPQLIESGVGVFKIEGRQRSHAYVREATRVFREAIDAYYEGPSSFSVKEEWQKRLASIFEGSNFIQGVFEER